MSDFEREEQDDFQFRYINLLAERVGGRAIDCSDQWFASCDNLVKPGRGVFKEGQFTEKGQWMDGWESRRSFGRQFRRSGLDHDWCTLRLGLAGRIRGVDVDTHHFRGNAPLRVAVDAAHLRLDPEPTTQWTEIIPQTDVLPDEQNPIPCASQQRWTHLRLRIYPDGGVARFRAFGEVIPDPLNYVEGELVDLASAALGGRGVAASDEFFSSTDNLVMPGRGVNMGDGWETRRRRDDSNDWAIIRLGKTGTVRKVIVDTAHLRGNFPGPLQPRRLPATGSPGPRRRYAVDADHQSQPPLPGSRTRVRPRGHRRPAAALFARAPEHLPGRRRVAPAHLRTGRLVNR
jgi:allantoicase